MTTAPRTCAYCEAFDGGGLARVENARQSGEELRGDCLNRRAPHFQTTSLDTCNHFYPDSGGSEDDQLWTDEKAGMVHVSGPVWRDEAGELRTWTEAAGWMPRGSP